MKILVLQHAECEHPGFFRALLDDDGHEWVPVELDQGEQAPPLDDFDALWVMGGPMDTWQEDAHPWLVDEKKLIGVLRSLPEREDILPDINENLVVELYSK